MNKSDIISQIAEEFSLPRTVADKAVNKVFAEIVDHMASGGRVELRDFGVFFAKQYGTRSGRNPRTGEGLDLPARTLPRFKAGKKLRDRLYASFEQDNA